MALTPIVFFELATPGFAVPCPDPQFLAVKLTKRFVERLRVLASLCREQNLASVVVDGQGLPIEFMGMSVLEPSAQLHVMGNQLLVSVWGRRVDDGGEPGKLEHLADTWLIDVASLAHRREEGPPVALHAWEEWDDPDVDLAPFGERVYATLRTLGLLPKYQRIEWFDPTMATLMASLSGPAVKRSKRPARGGVMASLG